MRFILAERVVRVVEPTKPPKVFATPEALRAWFEKHGAAEKELWIKYYKVGSSRTSVRYQEALDEALCVGWIDGLARSIDDESYMQRWTPRKKGSYWSKVNVGKAERLIAAGRMKPAGLAAFQARDPAKAEKYSFEQMPRDLPPKMASAMKANARAWAFWQEQPASYRKMVVAYLTSAKKEETTQRRLAHVIAHSARGERIPQFVSPAKRARTAPKTPKSSRTRAAGAKRSRPAK